MKRQNQKVDKELSIGCFFFFFINYQPTEKCEHPDGLTAKMQ